MAGFVVIVIELTWLSVISHKGLLTVKLEVQTLPTEDDAGNFSN